MVITFNNKTYAARRFKVTQDGKKKTVVIASHYLSNALGCVDEQYKAHLRAEARRVYKKVYDYAWDTHMTLPAHALIEYVNVQNSPEKTGNHRSPLTLTMEVDEDGNEVDDGMKKNEMMDLHTESLRGGTEEVSCTMVRSMTYPDNEVIVWVYNDSGTKYCVFTSLMNFMLWSVKGFMDSTMVSFDTEEELMHYLEEELEVTTLM
jgi:hypothetical protein